MVIRPEKFYLNSDRIKYLIELREDRQEALAKKLAWEWFTTKLFDKHDFEAFLDAWGRSVASD